ncbi:DUF1330 domain-containing protein [Gammaproteobacteria bacterium]|jgi:uncharacterized protein (DUF1330 family)|nr:DUF1330 domain-containing protein [Gammaproteobacteria bacterium]|tara:strand:- start:178 stop:468 length:291 start_codon:yes stop_codon:yes gene_type:complete
MKGYVLGLLYMDNWDWYEKYLPETAKLIEEHGGKYLASGVKPDMKEGIDQPSAYVLLEFPDVTSAQNWYNDPKYKPLIDLRNSGGKSEIFIIPGGI